MKFHKLFQGLMVLGVLMVIDSCALYKDPIYITTVDAGIHMGPENKAGRDLTLGAAKPERAASSNMHERLTRMYQPAASAPVVVVPTTVLAPKTQVIEACDRLIPPIIGQIPRLGPDEIAGISKLSITDANGKLLDELELIYKYASGKNAELQASFNKQYKSCRKVTVIVQ